MRKNFSVSFKFIWIFQTHYLFLKHYLFPIYLLTTKKFAKNEVPSTDFYSFKVNNRNTGKRCEMCSKLTVKTPERHRWRCFGVSIINFEHILILFYCFYCWFWVGKYFLDWFGRAVLNGCSCWESILITPKIFVLKVFEIYFVVLLNFFSNCHHDLQLSK